jgi:ferredoxin
MSKRRRAWRKWLEKRPRKRAEPTRRFVLLQAFALTGSGVALGLHWMGPFGASARRQPTGASRVRSESPVRPPTADADDAVFRRRCIRCGLCGTVCKSGCIRYFGIDEREFGSLTPYIDVRARSCVLCMRCTQVCPTGALSATEEDLESVAARVRMGTAVVDADRCLSYQGRICGYCHDACPLPGRAIRLVPAGKPVVIADGCVGCGRCVELCPQSPTAIDVKAIA